MIVLHYNVSALDVVALLNLLLPILGARMNFLVPGFRLPQNGCSGHLGGALVGGISLFFCLVLCLYKSVKKITKKYLLRG